MQSAKEDEPVEFSLNRQSEEPSSNGYRAPRETKEDYDRARNKSRHNDGGIFDRESMLTDDRPIGYFVHAGSEDRGRRPIPVRAAGRIIDFRARWIEVSIS
jgi:hypothetical protein